MMPVPRRLLLGSVAVAVAVVACVSWWFHRSLWRPLDRPAVQLEIVQGSSARGVLALLSEHELLPSVLAGRVYLAAWGRDRGFRYGHYTIPAGSRPVDAIEQILAGRVEPVTVTVPEGSTAATIGILMSDAGFGDAAVWADVATRRSWIRDIAPEANSLEGFLFPETYRFAVGLSAEAAARHMIDTFRAVWAEEILDVEKPWGSLYEVLILASLVEAETSVEEERSRIAGVFTNRLRLGMLLQCDPTVQYALIRRGEWRGRLLRRHWLLDDPYNTYRYPGLPPGPINSPGRAALAAALAPETHHYLYFVARPTGGHTFSETLREHNQAVAVLRRSGR
jgi:UPF0755 protein